MTLLLNRSDVMSVLGMDDCVGIVEKAFGELSNGTAVLPLRIAITPPEGLAVYMPAYLKDMGALACKVVSVYKNNPVKHDLPTTIGKVLLQDPGTGDVVCIMDGGYLTAVRTGAASGVATKYLDREDKGQTCAVFGAGVQAKMQLWAMASVRDLDKACIYDVSPEAADRFIAEMGRLRPPDRPCRLAGRGARRRHYLPPHLRRHGLRRKPGEEGRTSTASGAIRRP
jgi:ornithine cyclodeaminase/alanine dehydrogenase